MNNPVLASSYKNCLLCPRLCGVDREAGQRGYCGETSVLRIGYAGIYHGEEPPIKGSGGSGTIFISGCNVGCVFCQCFQLSHKAMSRSVDAGEFAEICLALQERGAENINIVTGSHAAVALAQGFDAARAQGLVIPVLWNSSGYEGSETLDIIKDFVNVYMPDLKTLDAPLASMFLNAPDYGEHAKAAILKMMEFKKLRFGASMGTSRAQDVMLSGVMVRHLILPGFLENTRQVVSWFAEHCKGRALLSVMTQYTPAYIPGITTDIPRRGISESEYEAVLAMLDEFGIDDGFCQEYTPDINWLPDFDQSNPFPSDISAPIWHWRGKDSR
ncbi:MAG: radical SAM protein [Treponema sp.]|nr:radical SAM protein [Treponema sp.]